MARYEKKLNVGSLVAAGDLSANVHYLVAISAANTVDLAGVGDTAIGVLGNDPDAAGKPAEVMTGVIVPVVAGEAIAAGADVAPDATGRARTAVTDDHIFGIALEAAGDAGEEFACLVMPQQASLALDGQTHDVPVAANKVITADKMVCLDTDGYLVDAGDATAVSFWGMALETADNTGGADGDISCNVRRFGVTASGILAGAGLAATDVGQECWVGADSGTITMTPGDILVGIIEEVESATEPIVRYVELPIVGERTNRQREIHFSHSGNTLDGKNAFEDREFLRKYVVLAGYADVETAPGGADVLTIELDDGATQFAVTITGAATHGENKTPAPTSPMLTTDTDVTLADTAALSSDVKGMFLVEDL
jgi:hypothetical protein